jgi:hypothetical protein
MADARRAVISFFKTTPLVDAFGQRPSIETTGSPRSCDDVSLAGLA